MKSLRAIVQRAVLLGLAAPSLVACGTTEPECTYTRPNPLPSLGLDDGGSCNHTEYSVTVSDENACGLTDDALDCETICGQPMQCTITSATTVDCTFTVCGKARASFRRNERRRKRNLAPIAEHLRASIRLEAASIDAFYTLSRELGELGAPRALCEAAEIAARDEQRHTRAMIALAARFGVEPPRARRARAHRASRELVAVALENAVEGCVHETYGAAIARFQAARASDHSVRDVMRRIAREEENHASLALRVARFASVRLDDRGRRRIARARERAVARLFRALRTEPPADLAFTLGLPNASQALAIANELRRALW